MRVKTFLTLLVVYGGIHMYQKHQETKRIERYREMMRPRTEQIARESQKHFNGAQVVINDAYPYDGPSYMKPYSMARHVAVDVSIKNVNPGVDLDDIDIVDADTNKNYGSDPQMVGLDPATGQILPDQHHWLTDIKNIRILLIYLAPKTTRHIRLAYWKKDLTTQTTALKEPAPPTRPRPAMTQLSGNPTLGGKEIILTPK